MKLYCFPPSPNSRKVLAVIHHLGLSVETVFVDLTKGEQTKPEFLRLNPNHKAPVLQDGDFVLWESNAIMQYLASRKPANTLWPSDSRRQADISRWQCWQLAHWGPPVDTLIFERMLKPMLKLGEPDSAAIKRAEERFHEQAKVLDGFLKGRKWLVGENLTLADYAVGSVLMHAQAIQLPLTLYGEIRRWFAALEQQPGWKASAPSAASAA